MITGCTNSTAMWWACGSHWGEITQSVAPSWNLRARSSAAAAKSADKSVSTNDPPGCAVIVILDLPSGPSALRASAHRRLSALRASAPRRLVALRASAHGRSPFNGDVFGARGIDQIERGLRRSRQRRAFVVGEGPAHPI